MPNKETSFLLDQAMEEGFWITREGKKIPIRLMSDTHLLNTIRYLVQRERIRVFHQVSAIVLSSMSKSREEHIEALQMNRQITPLTHLTPYKLMVAEVIRRGLFHALTVLEDELFEKGIVITLLPRPRHTGSRRRKMELFWETHKILSGQGDQDA